MLSVGAEFPVIFKLEFRIAKLHFGGRGYELEERILLSRGSIYCDVSVGVDVAVCARPNVAGEHRIGSFQDIVVFVLYGGCQWPRVRLLGVDVEESKFFSGGWVG